MYPSATRSPQALAWAEAGFLLSPSSVTACCLICWLGVDWLHASCAGCCVYRAFCRHALYHRLWSLVRRGCRTPVTTGLPPLFCEGNHCLVWVWQHTCSPTHPCHSWTANLALQGGVKAPKPHHSPYLCERKSWTLCGLQHTCSSTRLHHLTNCKFTAEGGGPSPITTSNCIFLAGVL